LTAGKRTQEISKIGICWRKNKEFMDHEEGSKKETKEKNGRIGENPSSCVKKERTRGET